MTAAQWDAASAGACWWGNGRGASLLIYSADAVPAKGKSDTDTVPLGSGACFLCLLRPGRLLLAPVLLVTRPFRVGAHVQRGEAAVGAGAAGRVQAPEVGEAGRVLGVALEVLAVDEHRLATEVNAARARGVGHGWTSRGVAGRGQEDGKDRWDLYPLVPLVLSVLFSPPGGTRPRPGRGYASQYFFAPAAVSSARLTA